eukprot:XP_015151580.2 uncharacterized serine/threonine-protein kinase SgK494 [Gallus gallus]
MGAPPAPTGGRDGGGLGVRGCCPVRMGGGYRTEPQCRGGVGAGRGGARLCKAAINGAGPGGGAMGAASSGSGPGPPQGRAVGSWVRALLRRSGSVQGPVPVPGLAVATEEPPFPGWPLPQLVSLFLPEFPVRPSARQQQLKILGLVAKGSFGTILKVLDCRREKVCAVKVVPKVEVLRRDTLKQCKEEVSIQRQVRHPFVHGLGDSWQGQRHLFIMLVPPLCPRGRRVCAALVPVPPWAQCLQSPCAHTALVPRRSQSLYHLPTHMAPCITLVPAWPWVRVV